ncbi:MAG: helix-turn-helix transcriptional regulator [Xanthomonadaceae bacterium]|nr:helix-turn-helix transcriptional regulator [Xanthomonadaceae bacterium]
MNIFYDSDRDYAEVFFKKTANYGEELNHQITAFKSEKTNKIVGYGFEDASRSLFEFGALTPAVKLATLLRILRAKEGLTQEQAAKKIGNITFRHYQRLESGEENPTLETIAGMMAAFPNADFSVILKHKPRAA